MIIQSIRWRWQLWQAFLLSCILTGFGLTAYQLHRTHRFGQIDEALERRVVALVSDVREPPRLGQPPVHPLPESDRLTNDGPFYFRGPPPGRGPGEFDPAVPPPRRGGLDSRDPRRRLEEVFERREIRLSAETLNLFEPGGSNDCYFAVWSPGGKLLKRSLNAPSDPTRPDRSNTLLGIQVRLRDQNREAYQFTEIGECVLAGRSMVPDLQALRRFAGWLVAAGGAVLALGLGGGWFLARRALRPIEAISSAASRISAGNLAERINLADTDSELGRLAGVLNSTFARLEAAFAQQKQFTADASHELRTPLAVLIAEAQTTLARERSAAEYRETIEAGLETAQQMRRLTQSLLELARYDAGQETLTRCPVDLADLARAGVERILPLAEARRLRVQTELRPAEVLGDAERLDQVLTNLLANAIDYNRDDGEVRVSTRAEAALAVATVSDSGCGIAPDECRRIFERFYRADPSRGRAGGHTGLGLAICRAIVEAHGGSIELSSQLNVGSTFTVKLPRR
jgi:heavy metal sensor kinase